MKTLPRNNPKLYSTAQRYLTNAHAKHTHDFCINTFALTSLIARHWSVHSLLLFTAWVSFVQLCFHKQKKYAKISKLRTCRNNHGNATCISLYVYSTTTFAQFVPVYSDSNKCIPCLAKRFKCRNIMAFSTLKHWVSFYWWLWLRDILRKQISVGLYNFPGILFLCPMC